MRSRKAPESILAHLEKITKLVEELPDVIEMEEMGILAEVKKGRAVLEFGSLSGRWKSESFHRLLDGIGDHGGIGYRPADIREMEIWQQACAKAVKFLETRIRLAKKNPSRI